jgi:hypothetical protein
MRLVHGSATNNEAAVKRSWPALRVGETSMSSGTVSSSSTSFASALPAMNPCTLDFTLARKVVDFPVLTVRQAHLVRCLRNTTSYRIRVGERSRARASELPSLKLTTISLAKWTLSHSLSRSHPNNIFDSMVSHYTTNPKLFRWTRQSFFIVTTQRQLGVTAPIYCDKSAMIGSHDALAPTK